MPIFFIFSNFSGNHKAGEIQGQTRQHSRLINLLGVKQIVIGINKMDCDTAGYKEERYTEIANEMKNMLTGISSRTLSDKLRYLTEEGLVLRVVTDGPPVKVSYELSAHGRTCGRLLSPLVAHLKMVAGSVVRA